MISHLWSNRWVRFMSWGILSLITFYALLCAGVGWYGSSYWSEVQARVKVEGETLDFPALLPEQVPAEGNFCALPALEGLALTDKKSTDLTLAARRERLLKLKLTGSDWPRPILNPMRTGTAINLKAWADWLDSQAKVEDETEAAGLILKKLSDMEPLVTELSAGLERPHAQWTPALRGQKLPKLLFAIELPQYAAAQAVAQSLFLHSAASLQMGKAEQAVQDLRVLARQTEASAGDTFLIGQLVAASSSSILADGVWTLCHSGKASAEQLDAVKRDLQRLDFMQGGLLAFRGEMAAAADAIQRLAREPGADFFQAAGADSGMWPSVSALLPQGLFHLNAAELCTLQLDYCILPYKSGKWPVVLKKAADCELLLKERKASWHMDAHHFMVQLTMVATLRLAHTICHADARMMQAALACELAKYKLARGSYPQSLAELGVPAVDPASGKAMGYRLTEAGYMLWSVGSDLQDDAGRMELDPKKKKLTEAGYKGDWTWQM